MLPVAHGRQQGVPNSARGRNYCRPLSPQSGTRVRARAQLRTTQSRNPGSLLNRQPGWPAVGPVQSASLQVPPDWLRMALLTARM
jgi:hypothetical protein